MFSGLKMMASWETPAHVINYSSNELEVADWKVMRAADEKQQINFAWPNCTVMARLNYHMMNVEVMLCNLQSCYTVYSRL